MTSRTHPAGRARLEDRLGRQPDFFKWMIARLSDPKLPALGGLTTRELSDPSIALLDAFSCVADVVTFYRERLLNEGYLGTATERRALAELAALVGYQPRPGVAAATSLAFTMEKDARARLDAGLRTQSVPGPGEQAQTFETSDDVDARYEYNELTPRKTRPQDIRLDNVLEIPQVVIRGTTTNARPGDPLLFYFDMKVGRQVLRTIADVAIDFDAQQTVLSLAPVHRRLQRLFLDLIAIVDGGATPLTSTLLTDLALGEAADVMLAWALKHPELHDHVDVLREASDVRLDPVDVRPPSPIDNVIDKLQPPSRTNQGTKPTDIRADDVPSTVEQPQLSERSVRLAADLKGLPADRLFRAWGEGGASRDQVEVESVHLLRKVTGVFGQSAPPRVFRSEPNEWPLEFDEGKDNLFIDGAVPEVRAAGHIVLRRLAFEDHDESVFFHRVHGIIGTASPLNRSAYGISGPAMRVRLAGWWDPPEETQLAFAILRRTSVFAGSEPVDLADIRDRTPVGECSASPDRIRLDELVDGLETGRVVAITGRWIAWDDDQHPDPKDATGLPVAELATIADVVHGAPPERANAPVQTTLIFTRDLQHCYRRDTVKINANVVQATQGETRGEVLGGGDASQAHQRFALKQWPLTFVPADTPDGIDSTLEVRVDDLRWHESEPGDEPGADERVYRTRRLEDGKAAVVFGDGARPRTAAQNIEARYRVGIGSGGNVDEGTITTLVTRPLGVKAVVNPIAATGGAGPDGADEIRQRAPIATEALDRLVGVADYAAFALSFAGIAQAEAVVLPVHAAETVVVTVVARDDAPIDGDSVLLRRLADAVRRYGDPLVAVRVRPRERMAFVLSAGLRIEADARWSDVERRVRARLLDRFGSTRRGLGQDLALAAIVECIQGTSGVDYVDVDAFGGIGPITGMTVSDIEKALQDVPRGAAIEPIVHVPGAYVEPPAAAGDPRPRTPGEPVGATLGTFFPDLPLTLELTEIRDGR